MKRFRIESWDPKYSGQIVTSKNSDEALAMVLGFYGGDQGYTYAVQIS